jgi:hypothetical protein
MSILVNTINDWKPFEASLLEWRRLCRQMKFLDSSRAIDEDHTQMGRILWGLKVVQGGSPFMLGVCWEWREVIPNVVALSNPMGVQSNVILNEASGEPVAQSALVLHLNAAVSKFRWQQDVTRQTNLVRYIAA